MSTQITYLIGWTLARQRLLNYHVVALPFHGINRYQNRLKRFISNRSIYLVLCWKVVTVTFFSWIAICDNYFQDLCTWWFFNILLMLYKSNLQDTLIRKLFLVMKWMQIFQGAILMMDTSKKFAWEIIYTSSGILRLGIVMTLLLTLAAWGAHVLMTYSCQMSWGSVYLGSCVHWPFDFEYVKSETHTS